jgi:methanogenic corrinoid protein MtbC1
MARQDEGLSISRAVSLWRQLESDGQDPLLDPAHALPVSTTAPMFDSDTTVLSDLREEWMAACLAFEEAKAEQILSYALALYPAETVCFEILVKSLAEVGEGWYDGTVTVQQEHFGSELTLRRLETLISAAPAPTRPNRVLIGCAPEDQHIFPGLLLTFLLKQRGWDAVYLGARVPAARFEATVAKVKPSLVILTAQHLHSAAVLLEAAQILKNARVPLAFGGRIFNLIPSLRLRIPGHFLGERLELAPKAAEQLLTRSVELPETEAVADEYAQALDTLRLNQTLIEAEVWRRLEALDIRPEHLSVARGTSIFWVPILRGWRVCCTTKGYRRRSLASTCRHTCMLLRSISTPTADRSLNGSPSSTATMDKSAQKWSEKDACDYYRWNRIDRPGVGCRFDSTWPRGFFAQPRPGSGHRSPRGCAGEALGCAHSSRLGPSG